MGKSQSLGTFHSEKGSKIILIKITFSIGLLVRLMAITAQRSQKWTL